MAWPAKRRDSGLGGSLRKVITYEFGEFDVFPRKIEISSVRVRTRKSVSLVRAKPYLASA